MRPGTGGRPGRWHRRSCRTRSGQADPERPRGVARQRPGTRGRMRPITGRTSNARPAWPTSAAVGTAGAGAIGEPGRSFATGCEPGTVGRLGRPRHARARRRATLTETVSPVILSATARLATPMAGTGRLALSAVAPGRSIRPAPFTGGAEAVPARGGLPPAGARPAATGTAVSAGRVTALGAAARAVPPRGLTPVAVGPAGLGVPACHPGSPGTVAVRPGPPAEGRHPPRCRSSLLETGGRRVLGRKAAKPLPDAVAPFATRARRLASLARHLAAGGTGVARAGPITHPCHLATSR